MEGGDNILDAIFEDDNVGDVDDDVEMIDIEEGELLHHFNQNVSGQNNSVGADNNEADKQSQSQSKNQKRRANKKKNKRKRKASGSNSIDINRFVLDACRRLKEKKSYMVYTAVGCLGVSALSDLIKEVDAIQACGGQKTADGRRFRTGGGVLWSIIKVREPQAYKEIMKKAKEFEKQFRQPNVRQPTVQKKEDSSQGMTFASVGSHQANVSDSTFPAPQMHQHSVGSHPANVSDTAFPEPQMHQHEPSNSEKRISVHDRLRIPVSYDDDLLGSSVDNNDAT